jgi:DNA-binding winged helix-turn-helix (wHTH) protein/tetratricopeptide (TPR) repeat protein
VESSANRKTVFRFGLFEADPASGELFRQGKRVRLQDQPFRMLVLLLEQPGEVVPREQLREKLWPANTFVEFDGGLKVALKKIRDALGDDADNPRFIETLPRRGYRFLAPVSVEVAFKVPDEIPDAPTAPQLEGSSAAPSVAASKIIVRRWRSPRLYACVAVASLAGLTIAAFTKVGRTSSSEPVKPVVTRAPTIQVPARRSVAVMEFRNASGHPENAWLSIAIPEMLSTELAAGDTLRLVPGEEVARMKRELHLESAGTLAKDEAARAGKDLNVDIVVVGSFTALPSPSPLGGRVRVDLRLQDATNGEIVAEVAETGSEQRLFDLVSQAGRRVRERLGVPGLSPTEEAAARASLPANPEAARLYAQGLDRLRVLEAVGARDLLEHAVAAEPTFPLSHMALMSSWKLLGYDQKARAEAKTAFDLSGNLPRADQLRIEGRYYEVSGEMDKAIAAYRALFALSPDSLEDGLLLAGAQAFSGKHADSLVTVNALRQLPEPLSGDPRIDMQQARVQDDVHQYLALVRRAAEKAERQGASLLQAKAQVMECNALHTLGQVEEAVTACEAALRVFSEARNPLDSAQTERFLGDIRLHQGRLTEALDLHRRALSIDERSGNDTGRAISLNELALDYEARGDLKQAEQLYRQSYALFLKVGHRYNAAVLAFNVGSTLTSLGKLAKAEKVLDQSLILAREAGGKGAESAALDGFAELAFVRGNLENARQHAETSVARKRQGGDEFAYVAGLGRLCKILAAQGDLAGARQKGAEALGIAEKIGASQASAETRLTLAQLDLEEGLASQAEPAIRQALDTFLRERMRDDELDAYLALSRCLLMQGRTAEARTAIDRAQDICQTTQNHAKRLRLAIADARVGAAQSTKRRPDRPGNDARSKLLQTIAAARRVGFVTLEYEARLALGEVLMKTDPAARAYVASLEKDARARGFELIANTAARLLDSRPA